MGCWNETCAISHLPIRAGDDVVFLLLTRTPYYGHEARSGCYIGDHWFPRTLPIFAKYNDYGSIERWTKTELPLIDSIVEGFRRDLFESRTTRRDEILHIPGRQKENLNWDNLLNWLSEGHVRVDRYAFEGRTRIAPDTAEKAAREYNEFVEKYGTEWEEVPKNASASSKKEIEDRNMKRQLLEGASDRYARELEQPTVLPCLKIMIRKDVWDSLLQMRVDFWDSKVGYDKILSDAKAWKEAAKKIRSKPDTLSKSISKLKAKNKKESADIKEASLFMIGHTISAEVGPDNVYELTGIRGEGTPPFQMGPHEPLKAVLREFIAGKKSASEKRVDLFMERFGQLRYVQYVMSQLRLAWGPTCGSGSQNDERPTSFEFYVRMAKLARDTDLEDSKEHLNELFAALEQDEKLDEWQQKEFDRMMRVLKTYKQLGDSLTHFTVPETPAERKSRAALMEMIVQDPNVRFSAGEA